jgi:ankyrin repeat protein
MKYNCAEVFGEGTPALSLAEAAGRGDTSQIDKLVSNGANVNAVGQEDITPLWWAAFAQNINGFEALLEKGADPNAQRKDQYPLMIFIAAFSDHRFLEVALKHGGDPSLRDVKSGVTPLYRAIEFAHQRNIDLLLAAKADVNAQLLISGDTLPMAAMTRADYHLVYRLFQAGSDPALTGKGVGNIADTIIIRSVHASNNNDPWRKKVLEYLAIKGVKPRFMKGSDGGSPIKQE